jgi:hypothetical protein
MINVNIEVGHRPGWPDNAILSKLVTHGVYRLTNCGMFFIGMNEIKGYGKESNKGIVVDDAATVSNVEYKWVTPAITVTHDDSAFFEARVAHHAARLYYTGIGGNCYTPIVYALEELRKDLEKRSDMSNQVTNLDQVLSALLGTNYGMGTSITNELIMSGLAMFVVKSTIGAVTGVTMA